MYLAAVALTVGASAAFAAPAMASTTITGDGSTLVAPLLQYWANGFAAKTGDTVTYSPVGSGQGISDVSHGIVEFGASDAPMTAAQAAGCAGCVTVPWALSATGIGFHIDGIHRLKLSGRVLAEIYLGQITNWNDHRIAALNKGEHLPNLKITPVFRSDGSGDTYAFTNFLTKVSETWKHQVGNATSVDFPTGISGKGNSGVTAELESTNGAIAYIAVTYLIARSLPAAAIENADGKFEYPNLREIEDAAGSAKTVPGSITDPGRKYKIAYPISTFTYAIVPADSSEGSVIKQFIKYAIGPGQQFAASLDFAALPARVVSKAEHLLSEIH
jgi:phosphate transport system substrate-binding protein